MKVYTVLKFGAGAPKSILCAMSLWQLRQRRRCQIATLFIDILLISIGVKQRGRGEWAISDLKKKSTVPYALTNFSRVDFMVSED